MASRYERSAASPSLSSAREWAWTPSAQSASLASVCSPRRASASLASSAFPVLVAASISSPSAHVAMNSSRRALGRLHGRRERLLVATEAVHENGVRPMRVLDGGPLAAGGGSRR